MTITTLEAIGLTRNEATVYDALLELGQTKTGPLVKQTHLHRVQIYDALASLLDKGLASYVIKENIKYFVAESPERILDFLHEKEDLARSLMEELLFKQQASKNEQQVSVYEGIRGLKSAMNNMLKELSKKDSHCVLASGNMATSVGAYYKVFQETKKKKGIKTRLIYDEGFRKQTAILDKTIGTVKFLPLQYFPSDTWIYKDKVLLVTYTARPPIAILITSQQTADSYQTFFDALWKQASP